MMQRASILLVVIMIAGCCPPPPPPKPAYTGPTDPMETVIAAINHNSGRIPTLWTQLNYSATLVDPQKHTSDSVSGDGAMLYTWPKSLLLSGNKDIAGEVFQLGSDDTAFWVKLRSGGDTYNFWWGHYANLGKPGCKPIPIRPDMVLQVLGISVYAPNFLEQPVPVMRFDNENDVYIFDRNIETGDHWETQEEIWYDRLTKLPTRVLLYGRDGRVALRALLSNPAGVPLANTPKVQWPLIARHYDLSFPDTGSGISFDFDDPALSHTFRRSTVPNAGSFELNIPDDPRVKVIQIDADVANSAMANGATLTPTFFTIVNSPQKKGTGTNGINLSRRIFCGFFQLFAQHAPRLVH
jgi:hypothetical protein